MTCVELTRWLEPVVAAVLEAGRAIRTIAAGPLDAAAKADGSPVTRADLAANQILSAHLAALLPGTPLLTEESPAPAALATAPAFWCVDPLDGTKEFLRGTGDYTVNVALVQGGTPVLGAVYAPASDTLWGAVRGGGAWRRDRAAADAPGPGLTLPCVRRDDGARVAAVSRSHSSPDTEAFLRAHGIERVLRCGSSVKICAVAEGAADVYPRLGATCLWDTAAGAVIAREAGCRVIDLAGMDLHYDPARGLTHEAFIVAGPGFRLMRSSCWSSSGS